MTYYLIFRTQRKAIHQQNEGKLTKDKENNPNQIPAGKIYALRNCKKRSASGGRESLSDSDSQLINILT